MLTYQDCLGMCSLDQDEIDAIAEHEHIPEIIALEYAEYVIHRADGNRVIRDIIIDDMEAAEAAGNLARLEQLRLIMRHFIATHPEHAERRSRRQTTSPDRRR